MSWADDADDGYLPPLPPEDRLWRHPAEVGAARRAEAATVTTTTVRTPLRQAVALASIGAVSGAMVVAGLFLSLSGDPVTDSASGPVTQSVAFTPVQARPELVDADDWADTVADHNTGGVAEVEVMVGSELRTGSAVAFQSDGLLLSSHDLVSGADQITVVLADGRRFVGEVAGVDHISGLSVLRIDDNDLELAHLGIWMTPPVVGANTVTLSGADGSNQRATNTISATSVQMSISDNQSLHGLLQLAGPLPAGGSGGAVVDETGAVIGIAVDLGGRNAHYAVPIGYARKIASDLVAFGEGRHAWIGIRGVDLTRAQREDLSDRGVLGAVRISSVLPDSPAESAELVEGDLINSFDGAPVMSMTDLVLELRDQPPGHSVEITYFRDGALYRTELGLLLRPDDDTT